MIMKYHYGLRGLWADPARTGNLYGEARERLGFGNKRVAWLAKLWSSSVEDRRWRSWRGYIDARAQYRRMHHVAECI